MFRAEISSCNFHLIVFCKNEDQKTQKSVRDDSNISSDIKFDKIFETLLLTARTTDGKCSFFIVFVLKCIFFIFILVVYRNIFRIGC